MKTPFLIVVVAGAMLASGGCATTGKRSAAPTPAPRTGDGKPYDFRGEGRIPPVTEADAPIEADVEEIAVSDDDLEYSEADAPPDSLRRPIVAPAVTDSTADGFRVQVFASADRDVAESAARAAQDRLGVPAYLDLEGGVYKVRVGDYMTRVDADRALPTFRGHYYPDAWVVPARIRVPRPSP